MMVIILRQFFFTQKIRQSVTMASARPDSNLSGVNAGGRSAKGIREGTLMIA